MDNSHILSLTAKHAGLDQQISEESRRPLPDTATLYRLKKEKLKVKEALSLN
jgi:hypothetical protein